jgi:predicted outer membrane repeat protein
MYISGNNDITLTDVIFSNNYAYLKGSEIYGFFSNYNLNIIGGRITDSAPVSSFYFDQVSVNIQNTVFNRNTGRASQGGAISCTNC